MPTGRFATLSSALVLALLGGCRDREAPRAAPAAPGGPVSPSEAARQEPAPLTPALGPLVHGLRKVDAITASAVGYGGGPGEFYTLSLKFLELARPGDFERLALDSQPIVRAMGWFGLAQHPSEKAIATIVEGARDRTAIKYCPGGCICYAVPLGEFARELLADAHHLGRWVSWPADGKPPASSQPLPLLTEQQLLAMDLEVLAHDELAALPFRSSSRLAQAIASGKLKLEVPALAELARFRKLAIWQLIKAVGRIDRQPELGRPALGFLVRCLRDGSLPADARLAAASALTRFVDAEAQRALEEQQGFLDTAAPQPLGVRFLEEIRLRREQVGIMKPIHEARFISQTEPLADRAIRGFRTDHPLAFDDLANHSSFGEHTERVDAARAAALLRIVQRHPEFSQRWNTYADVAYGIEWLAGPGHDASQYLRDDQLRALRSALTSVL